MRRFFRPIGYFLYNLTSWLPHYQCGHIWVLPMAIRRLAGKMMFDECGKKTDIGRRIKISTHVSLGDNSGIGDASYFIGKVKIGKDVMIGPEVMFLAANHNHTSRDIPLNKQGSNSKGIIIDDDVWIGARAIILDGVHVKKGTIVGAGAVVSKSTDEYSIVVGCPAREVKRR